MAAKSPSFAQVDIPLKDMQDQQKTAGKTANKDTLVEVAADEEAKKDDGAKGAKEESKARIGDFFVSVLRLVWSSGQPLIWHELSGSYRMPKDLTRC